MRVYILKRLALVGPMFLGSTVLIFVLMRLLPGDVVDQLIGVEGTLSGEARVSLRRLLGLDAPLHLQYLRWLGDLARLDLGVSLRTSQPVREALAQRLPVTIELAVLTVGLAIAVALPLGVVSALFRNRGVDSAARLFGLFGLSMPVFWLAALLILGGASFLHWLPPVVYVPFWQDPGQNLRQMAFPAIALALSLVAVVMRMTRSAMLEVLNQEYIQTARAKGAGEWAVVLRHALKNALIPVVTIVGVQFGYLLGGAVVVEQVFGLPGLGFMLLNAIYQRDYPVVQGTVVFVALFFILVNLAVDLLYGVLDPRVRYGHD
ncbi:MAG TPA: ABC transporter permease [Methylomirabilota bacterium]|jgi:peptide/nickel transport system permease protein|nr:ABC transporter permease [Methylomirabilota bacterium]